MVPGAESRFLSKLFKNPALSGLSAWPIPTKIPSRRSDVRVRFRQGSLVLDPGRGRRAQPAKVGVKVRESFAWDRELRGFGVQVMPSGLKSFVVQDRTPEGRTRRLVIGRYGLMTVEEARVIAHEKLSRSPRGSTQRRRSSPTAAPRRSARSATGISWKPTQGAFSAGAGGR